MRESLLQLAAALEKDATAKLRIATVTSLVGGKVTTDATATALVTTNSDSLLAVGDRVALLQQRSAWVVIARLSGGYPAVAVQTPIGSMTAFAGTAAPAGWLACDGSAVSRTTYPALFAACGTTYGAGNGSTTFNLPNLGARFPVGPGNGRAAGATGGAETVTLTAAQMPSHTHTGPSHTHTGPSHTHSIPAGSGTTTVQSGTGATVANASAGSTGGAGTGATGSAGTGATGSAGSGGSHENMPPYLTVTWIIRAS